MIHYYISMVLVLWALVFAVFYAMVFFGAILALVEYVRERRALLKKIPAFRFSSPLRALREIVSLPSTVPVISVRQKMK